MTTTALPLTAAWMAEAMRGSLVAGAPETVASGVSIDTRTLEPGELYIGIRGEHFDGAEFAPQALARGACGIVVPRGRGTVVPQGSVAIEVDDTTVALQALGHAVRMASGARVVAITGSAGKTTTKEITADLLALRYRVERTRGNFNNQIGLPLSLVAMRSRPDVAVLELGMNHAGETRELTAMAEPDVRVWTNVGDAHLGFFDSVDALADAKAEILEGASPTTHLVVNADDARVMARSVNFAGRTTTFAIERPADVRAVNVETLGVDGVRARVETRAGSFDLESPLVGLGNLYNVLAATSVALILGVPVDALAARLRALVPAAHRGEVVRLRGLTLVDDSYNASPAATLRSLAAIADSRGHRRRLAVLGEMLELGDHSARLHAEVGAAAAASVDWLFAVGGAPAAALARAAADAGLGARATYLHTSDEAASIVADAVRDGDLLLVKGSRGIRTERIVERLKTERG